MSHPSEQARDVSQVVAIGFMGDRCRINDVEVTYRSMVRLQVLFNQMSTVAFNEGVMADGLAYFHQNRNARHVRDEVEWNDWELRKVGQYVYVMDQLRRKIDIPLESTDWEYELGLIFRNTDLVTKAKLSIATMEKKSIFQCVHIVQTMMLNDLIYSFRGVVEDMATFSSEKVPPQTSPVFGKEEHINTIKSVHSVIWALAYTCYHGAITRRYLEKVQGGLQTQFVIPIMTWMDAAKIADKVNISHLFSLLPQGLREFEVSVNEIQSFCYSIRAAAVLESQIGEQLNLDSWRMDILIPDFDENQSDAAEVTAVVKDYFIQIHKVWSSFMTACQGDLNDNVQLEHIMAILNSAELPKLSVKSSKQETSGQESPEQESSGPAPNE